MSLKERIYEKLWDIGHMPGIKLFAFFFVEILGGYRVYKKLVSKYGIDIPLYLCPYKGTGDIYNIGRYFHSYLKKNGISQYEFLFRGKSEKSVGKLFNINGDTILTDRETRQLMRFVRFAQPRNFNIIQLHHLPFPCESNGYFANLEDLNICFSSMFKNVTMGLDSSVKPADPQFLEEKNVDRLFVEKGLLAGKTVILSPYSSSAQVLGDDIWKDISSALKSAGYTVATNCASENERPIAGTEKLTFEYKYAKAYLKCAGYFIGARSGLCDVISSVDCKKIVLTPYWSPSLGWDGSPGKTMRFYGMWPNYRCSNTAEIEYTAETITHIPGKIVSLLTGADSWEQEIKLCEISAKNTG